MRGMAELIALRMRRRMPSSVVLSLHTEPVVRADEAWLMPSAADAPSRADLRALIGLRVVVTGPADSAGKVAAWCAAAESAGALIVMGYATDGPLKHAAPLFAGGDIEELTRRVAELEARYGAATA